MSTDNEADVYDPKNEIYYGPALPLETNRYLPYRYPDDKFNATWRDKVLEVIDKYSPDAIYFDSRTCIIGESYRYQIADHYYHTTGHTDGIITYKQEDFPAGIGVYDLECGHFAEPKPLYGSLMTDLRTILPGVLYKIQSTNQQKRSLSSYAILFPKMEIYC